MHFAAPTRSRSGVSCRWATGLLRVPSAHPAQQALPDKLTAIVGALNVERGVEQRGLRMGRGEAFVVVKPGSLARGARGFRACVDADACVIPQGANTGLTGGSNSEMGVDRPTVVINMLRLNHIMPIDDGKHGARRCRHPFGVAKGRHAWQGVAFRPRIHLSQPDDCGGHRLWLGRNAAEEGACLHGAAALCARERPRQGGADRFAWDRLTLSQEHRGRLESAAKEEEEARQRERAMSCACTQNDKKKEEGVGLLAKSVLAGRVHCALS